MARFVARLRPSSPLVAGIADDPLDETASALGRPDHRLHQRPLRIRYLARVTQTTSISRPPMLCRPGHLQLREPSHGGANHIRFHRLNFFLDGFSGQRRVEAGEAFLLAIGCMRTGRRDGAGSIERQELLGRQRPSGRAKILPELIFVAGADGHRRLCRTPEQPVDGDLRRHPSRLGRDQLKRIDDAVRQAVACRGLTRSQRLRSLPVWHGGWRDG